MNDRRVPVVPRATYRLQLRPGFGFDDAAAIAPYLQRLGVSHVYSSPYLQAAPGSTHGYDVVDPRRVNRELGGEEGHRRYCEALDRSGLGQVLDIVPNHMAISGPENPWWLDVLENGPSSRYAPYFDVDWDPPETYLRDQVLLPILGDHYGEVLEAGGISIGRRDGELVLCYEDHRLPIAPRSLDALLADAAVRARSDDLAFIADGYGRLPPSTAVDRSSVERRHRDKEVLRRQLARLIAEDPAIGRAIDEAVESINARPEVLDELLSRQNYRLAYWRTAGRDLGYRRFFDVSTLIGLRMEDEAVFADTHALVLGWVEAGVLDGLRIDHPDGLRDPAGYLHRLRERAPRAWIVVEKILGTGEAPRSDWPVAGTTGYDFLGLVGGLFVDGRAEAAMSRTFTEFTGLDQPFATMAREGKLLVLRDVLGSELNRLTALLLEICESHRRYRDYTRHECHEVLREIAAAFPIYRTYVQAEAGHIEPADETAIEEAIAAAITTRPDLEVRLFEFVRDILTLRVGGDREHELVMRFQQLTGAVMAKGVEDTAFYRYLRLASLSEVGGDPGVFGTDVATFHAANEDRLAHWPDAMLATATHDTKRGEDARLRISMLSDVPEPWRAAVARWSTLLERYPREELLDRATEYLLYQTLVGTWPIEPDRLVPYLRKAVREAKVHTSWSTPDDAYEDAVAAFAESAVADAAFVADLEAFLAPLVPAARISSLAQTLLKLTAPGVPDIYQGTERWDLSLVDPDNRRPVDFTALERLLTSLEGASPESVVERMDEGAPKLWVLERALSVRRDRPGAFGGSSTYRPLTATGERADHLVGYVRGEEVAVLVPRLVLQLGLGGGWGDTSVDLGPGEWLDVMTGDRIRGGPVALDEVLRRFPVALLVRDRATGR
jgi:(1->4)-alpha-D-glucan 1-alpha-D-glucosylmutase